jgi:hypothetical protein
VLMFRVHHKNSHIPAFPLCGVQRPAAPRAPDMRSRARSQQACLGLHGYKVGPTMLSCVPLHVPPRQTCASAVVCLNTGCLRVHLTHTSVGLPEDIAARKRPSACIQRSIAVCSLRIALCTSVVCDVLVVLSSNGMPFSYAAATSLVSWVISVTRSKLSGVSLSALPVHTYTQHTKHIRIVLEPVIYLVYDAVNVIG